MATEPLKYYPWHWRDFRASRKVQRMNYIERGLYRELLDECWAVGFIPNDLDELADICGCPKQVLADAWQVLSKCFIERDGVLINDKLDSLRTDTDKLRATRAAAGRAGALAKADKQANAKQVLANAQQVPYRRGEESKAEQKQSRAETASPSLEQQEIPRHVQIAKKLRAAGCMKIQSGNPVLLEWVKAGYTDAELEAAIGSLADRGKLADAGAKYLDAILSGNREDAAKAASRSAHVIEPAKPSGAWAKAFPR